MQTAYDPSRSSQTRSHVAQRHGLPQSRQWVSSRNELLTYETGVFQFEQLSHDRRIVDLLRIVEFRPARIPGRVNVANDILALFQSPDHVAVHDLNVINVEEQLDSRRADFAQDAREPVKIIALVARMTFHRMRMITRVEMLDAD